MANGRLGRPAKNLLYKHSIAAYTDINGNMALQPMEFGSESNMTIPWQNCDNTDLNIINL